ncbi:hypothetical protein K502DRAFT_352336 [Neoconidiobolus thromboides FSU 785]|nr:hypothetical protein K502DRAFT_352336 [Neoconidiobolus thromboides FSU 785]
MGQREKNKRRGSSRERGEDKRIDFDYLDKEDYGSVGFHWHKKDKDSKREVDREEAEMELKKLKMRREQRERERAVREEERLQQQRQRDLETLGDWESREIKFHLDQLNKRAELRINNNRAKAIDYLAIIVPLLKEEKINDDMFSALDKVMPLEIPYKLIEEIDTEELRECKKDSQIYLELEEEKEVINYWNKVNYLINEKLINVDYLKERIPIEVLNQIDNMMRDKTLEQLNNLKGKIEQKLNSKLPIDIDYWELNLKRVKIWKIKKELYSTHNNVLNKWIDIIKYKQIELAQENIKLLKMKIDKLNLKNSNQEVIYDEELMEPKLLPLNSNVKTVDYQEDRLKLLKKRKEILKQLSDYGMIKKNEIIKEIENPVNIEEAKQYATKLFNEEREGKIKRGEELDEDEEIFSAEAKLDFIRNSASVNGDGLLKKPLYFNRVNVGYEWNKYNQTHYDLDNPPPKTVQGYKFHIYYPELKNFTPTYDLIDDPISEDTQIIIFKAKEPYKDLGFRIVKKDWELSHKRGFKSAFINNTLYLYFSFKRLHYRR